MFCLAPVLLTGYLFMAQTHVTDLHGPMIEMQTCDRGLGLDLKAASTSAAGLYAIDLQYGWKWRIGDFSFGLLPKAGLGYHDVQLYEEQSKGTFSVGGQFLLGYKQGRIGLEYWHMSNAGLGHQNWGLETIAVMGGWSFDSFTP